MSFRDILVHVPGHHSWLPHVRYAAQLAKRLEATLAGVFTIEQPYTASELQGAQLVATALVAQLERQWSDARNAGARFDALARESGLAGGEWLVGQGDPVAFTTYAAASRDLLVVGAVPGSLHASPTLAARLVIATHMPCLIVPEAFQGSERAFDGIALAWNQSVESVRALRAALPFLARASRVTVLRGRSRDYAHGMRGVPEFDLEAYFSAHGVAAERQYLDSADDSGDSLPRHALEAGADLLVMGAYGRTRFSEWVLGGATRHALHSAEIPLLMHH